MAEAIHFAHEHKILHRDLEPSNVLVDEFDAPRVTDFRLARRSDAEISSTLGGHVLGSPSYMAPEQAAAQHRRMGRWTDVYALGAGVALGHAQACPGHQVYAAQPRVGSGQIGGR